MTREEVIECMAREELIECMTDGAVNRPFGVASTIRDRKRLDMVAALAALESRGMVIVPKKNIAEWAECLDATAQSKGGWAWEDVLDEMRAMAKP